MDPYLCILKQHTEDPLVGRIVELEVNLKETMVSSVCGLPTPDFIRNALLEKETKPAVAGPSKKWSQCEESLQGQVLNMENPNQTISHLLRENVPIEWPLLVSLGSQYACDIPLSLVALHLCWFQNFYDLNHATNKLCLPYFSYTVPGFNECGTFVENPHYFTNLMVIEMK